MPKHYTPGHFIRRARRRIQHAGFDVELRWTDRPDYSTYLSPTMIESRVVRDGRVRILHHSIGWRREEEVDRLFAICTGDRPGITEDDLALVLARFGANLRTGEGMRPNVDLGYNHAGGYHVQVPVAMPDILGRIHDMVIVWPTAADYKLNQWATRHIEVARRRRDARGRVKELRFGGGLAMMLRGRPDGAAIAAGMIEGLAGILDGLERSDDDSIVTIPEIRGTVMGFEVQLTARDIRAVNVILGECRLDGEIVHVPREIPEQVAMAAAGRRLGELVQGLPLDPDIRIKEARCRKRPWSGTAIQLDLKPVGTDVLIAELASPRRA